MTPSVFSNLTTTNFFNLPRVLLQIALTTLILLHHANSEKILFYVGASSHSHRVAVQPLATALADKGHEVTVVAPFKPEVENPKIKEFCPQALSELNEKMTKAFSGDPILARMEDRNYDPFLSHFGLVMWGMCHMANEVTLRSPDFKKWMEESKFDLVVVEHPGKEIILGIAHMFGAKVIAFSPSPLGPVEQDIFGIPTEASWYSTMTLGSTFSFIPDNFFHEFNTITWYLNYKWNYLPKVDSLLHEVISEDIPPVADLIKNIRLYFMNTHFSNEYAKSLPPFVVPVGGMHVQDSKSRQPLPKNIEEFLNAGGNEGFIYISFGSVAKVSALPPQTRKGFFDAIRKYENAKFLIKWNDEIPTDLPSNILPLKWFPQQDLLAHPKCRGFISQGGLMSFQQATYHGVPVVIIPVFGDQPYNARSAVHQGNGIYLELADLNFDTFSDAIGQLLYNETLSTTAKEVARRFKDRPMTPVDTAVWWTEYVLRHNDTKHLKPLGIQQEWWQRRLLHFWAFVFTLMLLCCIAFILVILSSIRYFTQSQKLYDKNKHN